MVNILENIFLYEKVSLALCRKHDSVQNWHWVLLSWNWRCVFRGREYVDAISAFKVSFSAGYDSLGPRRSPHKMQPWTWMKCNEKCRSLNLSRNHSAKLAFFTGLFDTTSMQKQQTKNVLKTMWTGIWCVWVQSFKIARMQGGEVSVGNKIQL